MFETEMYILRMLRFQSGYQVKANHQRVVKTYAWENQESECTCVMETIQNVFYDMIPDRYGRNNKVVTS